MDKIGAALIAFSAIVAAGMAAAELVPLPLLKRADGSNLPIRKRLSCFVFSFIVGLGAWYSGYVDTPEQGWKGVVGVAVVAMVATFTGHLVHATAKKLKEKKNG